MEQSNSNKLADAVLPMLQYDQFTVKAILDCVRQEYDESAADQFLRGLFLQADSEKLCKRGLEYFYMNSYYTELQQLINKMNQSRNAPLHEWAKVYQLSIYRKQKRLNGKTILKHIDNIKTSDPALQSVIEFTRITVHHSMHDYMHFGTIIDKQYYLFDQVEDQFLLSFFETRIKYYLFVYYLVRNEVILARKYAFQLLTRLHNPQSIVNVHIGLGLSYTFETYEKAMYHLQKARKMAKQQKLDHIVNIIEQKNIPFIAAHFKKVDNITSTDKSEQAHIEIAKGNFEKAKTILNEIPIDSPFKIYYLGMAKQDKQILYDAYIAFLRQRSDHFFARLPARALQELKDKHS